MVGAVHWFIERGDAHVSSLDPRSILPLLDEAWFIAMNPKPLWSPPPARRQADRGVSPKHFRRLLHDLDDPLRRRVRA
jgi:hypothetical protein